MAKQQAEIFMPPNILKAKMGGSGRGVDTAALRRAQAAMDALKDEFADWIAKDVAELVAARDTYAKDGDTESRDTLYLRSQDLKGQAKTFEFPLVARIAASLCKLLDGNNAALTVALVDAHVNAIRVIVKQNIKTEDDKTANTLAMELEARVDNALEKANA
ncbi:MAG TPA: hypothetical protein VFI93_08665 [Rhizomicrobium sp.]|jgi:hypothetical protein|nr:hypothetical protein [Rhizomicrobium sp.]